MISLPSVLKDFGRIQGGRGVRGAGKFVKQFELCVVSSIQGDMISKGEFRQWGTSLQIGD
jgi:hypothetical protein